MYIYIIHIYIYIDHNPARCSTARSLEQKTPTLADFFQDPFSSRALFLQALLQRDLGILGAYESFCHPIYSS